MSNKWAKEYQLNTDKTDNLRGGLFGRRSPSGVEHLKIGNVQPINNTPFSGNGFSLERVLARYLPNGAGGLTGEFPLQAFVYTPTSRFRCKISVYFESDNGSIEFAAGATPPTWRIRAMDRSPTTGREVPLQVAYPSGGGFVNLPDAYEFESAGPISRVELVLNDDAFSQAFAPTNNGVNVKIVASWEPTAGSFESNQSELRRLYGLCSVVIPSFINIDNNATP